MPTDWVGYVPIIRESDGRPCMVIIHRAAMDFLTRCRWRDRVVITRGPSVTDGVTVQRAPVQRAWDTTLPGLARPADLTETLLRLWAIPALTEWYRAQPECEPPVMPASPSSPTHTAALPAPSDTDAAIAALRAAMAASRPIAARDVGLIGEALPNGVHPREGY